MLRYFPCFCFILALIACDSGSSSKKVPVAAEPVDSPVRPTEPPPDDDGDVNQPPTPSDPLPEEPIPPEDFSLRFGLSVTKSDFLRRVGGDLADHAGEFHRAVLNLQTGVQNYCTDLSPVSLQVAQNQWKEAMGLWQHFEVFQIGPLAESAKSLKWSNSVWPNVLSYCKIDDESMKAIKNASYKLTANPNRKGLPALEYLLFDATLSTVCKLEPAVVNKWNALSNTERLQARCAYMRPLAADLVLQSETLSQKWGSKEENYISRILGDTDREHGVIQALYESLFYIDLEVKNKKVAGPAGHEVKHCTTAPAPCLDQEEFPFAKFSRAALDHNMRSFVDLIFGPKGETREGGFSALMRAGGKADVADRTESQVSELVNLINEDRGSSLIDLIAKQNQEDCALSAVSWLCRMRRGIQSFAKDLKIEYAEVLNVKPPEAAQGDSD